MTTGEGPWSVVLVFTEGGEADATLSRVVHCCRLPGEGAVTGDGGGGEAASIPQVDRWRGRQMKTRGSAWSWSWWVCDDAMGMK